MFVKAALVSALLAVGSIAEAPDDIQRFRLEYECDSGTSICLVPLAHIHIFAANASAMTDEIRRLRAENAHLKEIKGCARVEVVPRKTQWSGT